jgi:hypothetical protein
MFATIWFILKGYDHRPVRFSLYEGAVQASDEAEGLSLPAAVPNEDVQAQ